MYGKPQVGWKCLFIRNMYDCLSKKYFFLPGVTFHTAAHQQRSNHKNKWTNITTHTENSTANEFTQDITCTYTEHLFGPVHNTETE